MENFAKFSILGVYRDPEYGNESHKSYETSQRGHTFFKNCKVIGSGFVKDIGIENEVMKTKTFTYQ